MNTRLTELTLLTELTVPPALTEHEHAGVDGAAVAVLEALDDFPPALDPWQAAVALAEALACLIQVGAPTASAQREWLRRLTALVQKNVAEGQGEMMAPPREGWR